jgi:hypothetical protein
MKIGVILNPNALGVRRRVGLRGRLLALLDAPASWSRRRRPPTSTRWCAGFSTRASR